MKYSCLVSFSSHSEDFFSHIQYFHFPIDSSPPQPQATLGQAQAPAAAREKRRSPNRLLVDDSAANGGDGDNSCVMLSMKKMEGAFSFFSLVLSEPSTRFCASSFFFAFSPAALAYFFRSEPLELLPSSDGRTLLVVHVLLASHFSHPCSLLVFCRPPPPPLLFSPQSCNSSAATRS